MIAVMIRTVAYIGDVLSTMTTEPWYFLDWVINLARCFGTLAGTGEM